MMMGMGPMGPDPMMINRTQDAMGMMGPIPNDGNDGTRPMMMGMGPRPDPMMINPDSMMPMGMMGPMDPMMGMMKIQ